MNASLKNIFTDMPELHVSNSLLGDAAALQAAWDRDGYWFFRDVLDAAAIGRARSQFAGYLEELGVADRCDPRLSYNGSSLAAFPPIIEKLAADKVCETTIMNDARINPFFARLFGCPPFWIPFTQYRATPPAADRSKSRFDFIHEDGVYNEGLPFLICWIPLAEIDADVGGIAVAEGLHHGPCLHEKAGIEIPPIRESRISWTAWRRTTYRPGDVLLMDLHTPHSGIGNHSDRFRLSIDTRIMPSSGKVPYVGRLTAISRDGVTVRDAAGDHALALDERSYCRGQMGNRLIGEAVLAGFAPGSDVIIAADSGRVVNMRPQH
ncbi:MAG: phytanoyl-CoA dioxygenase family protein [Steroidobacteraceae bacterium]